MSETVGFSIPQKQLYAALKHMMKMEKSARKKDSTLEVTIINGFIRLVIPGVDHHIPAMNSGTAKFTIRLWYFTDIVKNEKDGEIRFTVSPGRLQLRGFTWDVATTFFENDRILRSIDLPANYKYLDIVRLYLSEKYTKEEIDFNNLTPDVRKAIDTLNSEIDKVSSTLKKYGFSRAELTEIILDSIRK